MDVRDNAGTERECRIVRRLVWMFRAERAGRFARLRDAAAQRMRDRRGRLIDEMCRLEEDRNRLGTSPPPMLEEAMTALAREVGASRDECLATLAELRTALAEGRRSTTTGLRHGGGVVLGHG
jgi:hypothetical protein